LFCLGQDEAKKPSIIYYDDGSIYIGEIIQNKNSKILIVNIYGDTLELSANHVKRIRYGGDIKLSKNRKFHFNKGKYVDFVIGNDGNSQSNGGFLNFGVRHRYTSRLDLGLGLGFLGDNRTFRLSGATTQWVWMNNGFLPLYATGQYYLSDWNARPYVRQDIGHSIGLNSVWNNIDRLRGGLYSRSSIGIHFASRKKLKYFFEFYQLIHKNSGSGTFFGDFGDVITYDFDIWTRRLGFAFGVTLF